MEPRSVTRHSLCQCLTNQSWAPNSKHCHALCLVLVWAAEYLKGLRSQLGLKAPSEGWALVPQPQPALAVLIAKPRPSSCPLISPQPSLSNHQGTLSQPPSTMDTMHGDLGWGCSLGMSVPNASPAGCPCRHTGLCVVSPGPKEKYDDVARIAKRLP